MEKKQREKIYREAAERVFYRQNNYCCKSISVVCNQPTFEYVTKKLFPEIFMFRPHERVMKNSLWWGDNEIIEPRIIALLLSAEMCRA